MGAYLWPAWLWSPDLPWTARSSVVTDDPQDAAPCSHTTSRALGDPRNQGEPARLPRDGANLQHTGEPGRGEMESSHWEHGRREQARGDPPRAASPRGAGRWVVRPGHPRDVLPAQVRTPRRGASSDRKAAGQDRPPPWGQRAGSGGQGSDTVKGEGRQSEKGAKPAAAS